MDKEAIQNRLKEIKATKDQLLANLNASIGVENELNDWLRKLEEKEKQESEEPKPQE